MYTSRLVNCAAATFLAVVAIAACSFAAAQTTAPNEWTWVGGSGTVTSGESQPGVYGTLGTPASGNIPGGRDSAATWTDSSGNFWLFGGEGADANGNFGQLNDLWEFNRAAMQWAWMGGSSTLPASCAGSATVACGPPGSYGTLGAAATANVPGGRSSAATWTDSSGNFWLFGGEGFDASGNLGTLDDLWTFNPISKEWAWISGSSTVAGACYDHDSYGYNCVGEPGVYGNLGVSASGNAPGGRWEPTTWVDADGQFWLYGGQGFDSQGNYGHLDDMWEFSPTTNEWTWMSGSNVLPAVCESADLYTSLCGWPAVYGALGQPAPGVSPGSRDGALGWTDSNGNFWLFGGMGSVYWEERDFSAIDQYDLWEFNPSTEQWTWMSGNSTSICWEADSAAWCGQDGIFGTLGTPAIGNIPPSRNTAATWVDTTGNLWLFGGLQGQTTYPEYFSSDLCNDVWEFDPSTNEWAWMNGNTDQLASYGTCDNAMGSWGALGTPAATNIPSGRSGSARWTDDGGNLWVFGGLAYTWNGTAVNVDLNDLWVYQPGPPTPAPSFELIASPNPIDIGALGTGTSNVTTGTTTVNILTAGGFNSPVSLSAASDPSIGGDAGITGSFSPATITGAGSSTLTVSVTGSEIPGADSVPLTITATSGGISQSIQLIVYVTKLGTIPPPTFSIPTGTYSTLQSVTINASDGNEFIYYTTDGTMPTASSPVYVNPITIAATTTLNAIAIDVGFDQSSVSSATYTISPPVPTFTFGASPTSLTVNSGSQGTTNLTVTPQNGFNSSVSFACSGMPAGATCSFSPTTVTPSGAAATTQLTIAVSAQARLVRPRSRPFLPATGLAIAGCFLVWKRRRLLGSAFVVMLLLVGAGLLSGCGSGGAAGGGGGGGSPQSYTVTVTATAGMIQQTTTVTLTEN